MADLKKRETRPLPHATADILSDKKTDGRAPAKDGNPAHDGASADWRELARRIQLETDSGVMLELVEQLITKLDQEKAPRPGGRKK